MSVIDTNGLLDYLVCPLRFTYKEDEKLDSFHKIKSNIYNKLFDYVMYLVSCDEEVTLVKLNNKLNYIWGDIKNSITYNPTIPERLSIKSKLNSFFSKFSDIDYVVYYSIPKLITVSNTIIMYNLFTFYQSSQIKSMVKVNVNHINLTENSSTIKLVSNLIYYDLLSLKDKYKHNVYLFKVDTTDIYSCIPVEKKELFSNIESIVKGIENKIFYPKSDYIACNSCSHKLDCSWSYNGK